jgi:hypothetical protein
MSTETDPVVLALRAALETGESPEIRKALGVHLAGHGRAAEALVEYELVLRLAPGDAEALQGAARAARAAGENAKAAAYALAFDRLQHASMPPTLPPEQDPADKQVPHLRLVASGGELTPDETPRVDFGDVGGMEDVKARLQRSFLVPVRNPDMYRKFGKRIGGGLVLYGPPGCGKTFLARALAGEIGARFFNLGLSDILDMWFGESEKKLHVMMENARRASPSVVFIDEVDAIGQRRSHLKGSAGRTLVNQLLSEMDGFTGSNDGLFFLAATIRPCAVPVASTE